MFANGRLAPAAFVIAGFFFVAAVAAQVGVASKAAALGAVSWAKGPVVDAALLHDELM
jgi:purine nucleoside permease